MTKLIITTLFSFLLSGCVTESVRTIPKKVSVDAGLGFNPCGSDIEGYQFNANGIITINCTNGNIYSVRNKDELQQMEIKVRKCQQQGFNDYTQCLNHKNKKQKESN